MKIGDLFVARVTRDIPPVVYFHEQSPPKLQDEVREYIVTGGFPASDPRARRVKSGIHEQFVHLLQNIKREMEKPGGPDNPASWISGFFGSGKSSFAKLLGLSLDGAKLTDGTPLASALLARNDSPRRQEMVDAWEGLSSFDTTAVVFDIGGVARDDEHIHAAALRQLQAHLRYSKNNLVAEHELRLERDGDWPRFLVAARSTLGKDWSDAKDEAQADDHFSHVVHTLWPDRYVDPTSWIDSKAGTRSGVGTSVREAVEAIDAMIHLRAEQKVLFLVIDEVSQYVHQDEGRMLKLQSFVSELGSKLKGRVWLLATGQQKLDEPARGDGASTNIVKLRDRFPSQLRVHLDQTNIRDVVHKRLLRKKPEVEEQLGALFDLHRSDLKLHGYGCEEVTKADFVECYPLLPGHIGLLMLLTSSLRGRSTRVQGDDHAIRGLLQLLGELFREQKLADDPVGRLVTFDSIYEVQHTALDADVQATLSRVFEHPEVHPDPLAVRVAKAVALLELVQEQIPTTPTLVAQCLYRELGGGNGVPAVMSTLEKLRGLNLLSVSEKHGYKLQSFAGQEWQRLRDDLGVTREQISKSVQMALVELAGSNQERARFKGRSFPWTLWFSDGRQAHDVKLQDTREDSTVSVDFRFLTRKDDRAELTWKNRSKQELPNRLVWVVSDPSAVELCAGELCRSSLMAEQKGQRRASLSAAERSLLNEEEQRSDDLLKKLRSSVAEAFLDGSAFFRGQAIRPRDMGASFGAALLALANRYLPELYPHFVDIAVQPSELAQLLARDLSGASTKLMDAGLGILSLDAGKYVATCTGVVPTRIVEEISGEGGLSGQALIAKFVGPPYGYAPDLVKACCAGLLRGKKIRIRPEQGTDLQSYIDPGVPDVFTRDRDFRRAELFPALEGDVSQRDRIAIRKLFKEALQVNIEPDDEPIADAVFQSFPKLRDRVRTVERTLGDLPGRPPLPATLAKLATALEQSCRSRLVQTTVGEAKRHLDTLRDGIQELGAISNDLTEAVVDALQRAGSLRDVEVTQLRAVGDLDGVDDDAHLLESHLRGPRPWLGALDLTAPTTRVRRRYVEVRGAVLARQGADVEAVTARLRTRPGFSKLGPDEAHRVLRALGEALIDTSADAVAPSLMELRDGFAGRLHRAEASAHDRLDEELAKLAQAGSTAPVVKLEASLQGREVGSRAELGDLLRELEDRIGPQLDAGRRVRIV